MSGRFCALAPWLFSKRNSFALCIDLTWRVEPRSGLILIDFEPFPRSCSNMSLIFSQCRCRIVFARTGCLVVILHRQLALYRKAICRLLRDQIIRLISPRPNLLLLNLLNLFRWFVYDSIRGAGSDRRIVSSRSWRIVYFQIATFCGLTYSI